MRGLPERLLGTAGVDVEQAEGFFLNGRGPRRHNELGIRIEWGMTDVVRERGQIIEQGAHAMDRQAVLAKLSRVCGFRLVCTSCLGPWRRAGRTCLLDISIVRRHRPQ